MAAMNEEAYAAHLIGARQSGHSWSYFYRRNVWRYVRLIAGFGIFLALLGRLEMWDMFWLMTGMAAGVFLRDFGWVRSGRRVWHLTERFIDWEKVHQIAEGNDRSI